MRIKTTVTITTEHEVGPVEYEHIGSAAFLEMDKRHIEKYPACLLDIPGAKVEVNIERIKDEN